MGSVMRVINRGGVAIVCCAATAVAASSAIAADEPAADTERVTVSRELVERFGGKEANEAITHPKLVEVDRVKPVLPGVSGPKFQNVGATVVDAPGFVEASLAELITEKLLADDSYTELHNCGWHPEAAFRFIGRNRAVVDVVLCLRCNELKTLLNDRPIAHRGFTNETRGTFIRFIKRVFYKDLMIQRLSETLPDLP